MQNFDWLKLSSSLLEVLNSPLIIAILGGILATWLTGRWQQKAQLFSLRVEVLKKLMDVDGDWYDSLFGERRDDVLFIAQKVGEIIKVTNMVQGLFPYEDVGTSRKKYTASVADRMKLVGTADNAKTDELADVSGDRFREFLETLFKHLGVPR